MRLWTLHPKYLDARGLVALWREALLAQAVLRGKTRGYKHHPQLLRFRDIDDSCAAIAHYLEAVHDEATRRGYAFDASRIIPDDAKAVSLTATTGQLDYEWRHLQAKLAVRDPAWRAGLGTPRQLAAHPLFRLQAGPVAGWERLK